MIDETKRGEVHPMDCRCRPCLDAWRAVASMMRFEFETTLKLKDKTE